MVIEIIIPAYNEEKRIGGTLERLRAYASVCRWTMRVTVADDGSTDGTARVVEDMAAGAMTKAVTDKIGVRRQML